MPSYYSEYLRSLHEYERKRVVCSTSKTHENSHERDETLSQDNSDDGFEKSEKDTKNMNDIGAESTGVASVDCDRNWDHGLVTSLNQMCMKSRRSKPDIRSMKKNDFIQKYEDYEV